MSDHLPECRLSESNPHVALARWGHAECICDRLRACEARVRDEYRWLINNSATVVDETLDAARDAVAAIPWFDRFALGRRFRDEALAAIDALRGES